MVTRGISLDVYAGDMRSANMLLVMVMKVHIVVASRVAHKSISCSM